MNSPLLTAALLYHLNILPKSLFTKSFLDKKFQIFIKHIACDNLRGCYRSKNNHRKIIVIGEIIGSGKIDSFMCIKSTIKWIHFPNIRIESIYYRTKSISKFQIIFIFYNYFWEKNIDFKFYYCFESDGRLKLGIKKNFGRSTKKISKICL